MPVEVTAAVVAVDAAVLADEAAAAGVVVEAVVGVGVVVDTGVDVLLEMAELMTVRILCPYRDLSAVGVQT
jgi:hypothetical protein